MRPVNRPQTLPFHSLKLRFWHLILFATAASVSGCKEEEGTTYDSGYGDGYAVGYNTECKIRATLISGKFEFDTYADGYADGEADGIADCRVGKTP